MVWICKWILNCAGVPSWNQYAKPAGRTLEPAGFTRGTLQESVSTQGSSRWSCSRLLNRTFSSTAETDYQLVVLNRRGRRVQTCHGFKSRRQHRNIDLPEYELCNTKWLKITVLQSPAKMIGHELRLCSIRPFTLQ